MAKGCVGSGVEVTGRAMNTVAFWCEGGRVLVNLRPSLRDVEEDRGK